jgi:putative endonuclease
MKPDHRQRLGELGEALASDHLVSRGYSVIERNFRTRYGELDLVVADERALVFCEVKSRVGKARGLAPLASVGPAKRGQVRRMARQWLADRGRAGPRPPELRFDAIGITLDRHGRLVELDHVEGAF